MPGAAAGRGPLKVGVRGTHLSLSLLAQQVHTVSPVQRRSDLLVCHYESLQLCVQLDVLSGKHIAVVLQSIDFGPEVTILSLH